MTNKQIERLHFNDKKTFFISGRRERGKSRMVKVESKEREKE
jgi:hypothetical protein